MKLFVWQKSQNLVTERIFWKQFRRTICLKFSIVPHNTRVFTFSYSYCEVFLVRYVDGSIYQFGNTPYYSFQMHKTEFTELLFGARCCSEQSVLSYSSFMVSERIRGSNFWKFHLVCSFGYKFIYCYAANLYLLTRSW